MSESLHLRTTAFGGFHRQDVVDYIESTSQAHAAQLNALRKDLAAAQASAQSLTGEKARADALSERCNTLSARVDALEPLEAEVETLRRQVELFRPQAEAYDEIKDTLADIELDARARAAQILKEAEDAAAAKRTEAQALLDQILGEYSRTGQSAETSLAEVIDRLSSIRTSLSHLQQLQSKLTEE